MRIGAAEATPQAGSQNVTIDHEDRACSLLLLSASLACSLRGYRRNNLHSREGSMRLFTYGLPLSVMLTVSAAYGHVRVQPGEAQPGARQTYTVRVPTEGDVPTTSVEIEVPDGVSVLSVEQPAETTKIGDRIVSIRWKAEIPPGYSRAFTFEATNPVSAQELVWKAHQRFADGTSADWVETPNSRRPAPVTKLRRTDF